MRFSKNCEFSWIGFRITNNCKFHRLFPPPRTTARIFIPRHHGAERGAEWRESSVLHFQICVGVEAWGWDFGRESCVLPKKLGPELDQLWRGTCGKSASFWPGQHRSSSHRAVKKSMYISNKQKKLSDSLLTDFIIKLKLFQKQISNKYRLLISLKSVSLFQDNLQ